MFDKNRIPLMIIILSALFFRLYGIGHGISFHPDERHIIMTTERLSWNDLNPHFFAYGSLPFYLLFGLGELLSYFSPWYSQYDGYFWLGRILSATAGTLTVYFTYRLALELFAKQSVALVAAVLLAFNVFHLQLSHFYAVDILLTLLNVMALLSLLHLLKRFYIRDVMLSGLLIGASIGTKLSSLSLFLPLGIVFFIGFIRALKSEESVVPYTIGFKFIAVMAACCLGFVLVEPYALLDFKTFIANNDEQLRMVRGDSIPPYVRQYQNTTPYLYHLQQIFQYLMGWPVGILAFVGITYCSIANISRKRFEPLIVLAWAIAVFVIVARYQVKFPRYLIPIYPIFMISAAWLLDNLGKFARYRKAATTFTVTFSVLCAVAFLNIYNQEHPYYGASRWIFKNIKAGARIVSPHWDDTVPVTSVWGDSRQYQMYGPENQLPLYEPDSEQKYRAVAQMLAQADYLIFPTQRLPGSLPMVEKEMPLANNFLRGLYAGQLGYELHYTYKNRPYLGPFVWNDDTADESFSVYDHPKVTIFKNIEKLSDTDIFDRINNTNYSYLSREQLLAFDKPEVQSKAPNSILLAVFWIVIVELLAWITFPLFALLVRLPERGLAISKIGGVFILSILSWLLSIYGLLSITSFSLWSLVFLLAAITGAIVYRQKERFKLIFQEILPYISKIEILFLSSFALFAFSQALHPEIFWGEKPMEFTFLNYFTRMENMPPIDPWAAGNEMRYYYLGTYLVAVLTKLSGISAAYTFNLGLATVAATFITGLYGIALWLIKRPLLAMSSACLVALLSNLETLRLLFSGREANFDLFWATTRLYTSPYFTEYPIWSFLFADLHAHVIALPITLLVLTLALRLLDCGESLSLKLFFTRFFLGAALGSLYFFNTWDLITYTALVGLIIVLRPSLLLGSVNKIIDYCKRGVFDVLGLALGFAFMIYPKYFIGEKNPQVEWGTVREGYNTAQQIFWMYGHWLIPAMLGYLLLFSKIKINSRYLFSFKLLVSVILGIVPIALAFCLSKWGGVSSPPYGIALISSLLMFCSVFTFLNYAKQVEVRFAALLGITGSFILAGCELLYLIDRMNTVFKFHNALWSLLGLLLVALLPAFANFAVTVEEKRALSNLKKGVVGLFALPVVACLFASVINIWIMTRFQRVPGPRATLNGTAYLDWNIPEDKALIDWLNSNVTGTPTLLEAWGPSYQSYSRISMNTGLPTVLGWEHHVKQRGSDPDNVELRKNAIRAIYSDPRVDLARYVLRGLNVSYIVVGMLERQTYPNSGLKKFEDNPHIFPVKFKSGDSVIYGFIG